MEVERGAAAGAGRNGERARERELRPSRAHHSWESVCLVVFELYLMLPIVGAWPAWAGDERKTFCRRLCVGHGGRSVLRFFESLAWNCGSAAAHSFLSMCGRRCWPVRMQVSQKVLSLDSMCDL